MYPGAPEVCGDGLNNDCGQGEIEYVEVIDVELDPETPDDCHQNRAACTQGEESIPGGKITRTCELAGDSGGESSGDSCSDDSDCTEDGEKCVTDNDDAVITGYNIFNERFSWIDDREGGYCCGYGGVGDLGIVKTGATTEGSQAEENFICLNKNLIGTEEGKDGTNRVNKIMDGELENGLEGVANQCGYNWCWVKGISDAKFQIVTVHPPGKQPFDVVSNNDNWFVCNATEPKSFLGPDISDDPAAELKKTSNRFYCYQEGNHWSWAECAFDTDRRKNIGVKGRYEGEGLFTLPLMKDAQNPDEDPEKAELERFGEIVDLKAKWYNKFYRGEEDENFMLDFSGYNYLNFMVRFVSSTGEPIPFEEVNLPADVVLKIIGPENDLIFVEESVLGYVINNPFFDKELWMHVRAPIPDNLKGIRQVNFESSATGSVSTNFIAIRNVYLSKGKEVMKISPEGEITITIGEESEAMLCSAKEDVINNSWLTDADQGDTESTNIVGMDLCVALYGPDAWIGDDDEINSDKKGIANCCGNDPREYYSGSSKEDVTENAEGPSVSTRYGCWNSQPIASGSTIMNVEFKVKSWREPVNVTYPSIDISYDLDLDQNDIWKCDGKFYAMKGDNCLSEEDDCPADLEDCNKLPPKPPFPPPDFDNTIDFVQSPKILQTLTIFKNHFIIEGQVAVNEITISSTNDKVDIFFLNTITGSRDTKVKAEEVQLGALDFLIIAQVNNNYQISANKLPAQQEQSVLTYPCSGQECFYPLPGNPPYTIENMHPGLYELSFITKDSEILITNNNQPFHEYGNIKARKVSQQVLFYNEGDDAEVESGFYGCNAASFMSGHLTEDRPYCSVIDGMFCSFSALREDVKEKFTVINSWSSEPITKVGYDDNIPAPEENQNVSEYYQQLELQLKDKTFSADKRNHTATVLPARNFISNAEFATSGKDIPHWEIFDAAGTKVDNPKDKKSISETGIGIITLSANERLRSERIAVSQNVKLHLSQAQDCGIEVSLIDKDGNSQPAILPEFNVGTASYLLVEFIGACEVEKPMLQLIEDLSPGEYSYDSQPDLENFDARAGAACCPDNYCWNGYACVEPMNELTALTERAADGNNYRCIDGQWKETVLQYDWNGQRWGFCPQENQCFVLSQGGIDNTAEDFYAGNYPLCINDTEYIFDNYCDQGRWTSRTKFVATKLLEAAESDEFVLYCSPYKIVLPDIENKENYLGGDIPQAQQATPTIGQTLSGPTQILATCYSDIKNPAGRQLISDEQNTCINNVCVLRYKDSGIFKAAFATTLNKAIDDEDSFLISLGVPQSELQGLCQESPGGEFIECDLSGLDLPGDLYYSKKLNAVIYAKEGVSLSPGLLDQILGFFNKLFGGSANQPEKEFIADIQTFRDLYLLDKDGKKVRAVKEELSDSRQKLVAEYENFETPVCDYVQNFKAPPELELELLEEVTGAFKVQCSLNGSVHRVVLDAGLDFFWPQLTGKLRVNE